MIKAGDVLQGRYRIERQIGAGGMGAVFVATDERFNNTVAIKETLFTDERLRKAFEREARLLNSLRHHALPRVSDHFSEENGQFIVMEYIAGEDLSEMMLKRRKAFPVADVLDWSDQLLDALDFLHTQEMPVIHRDIKPQNLKLTPRGQIILLDFGLAKGNPADVDSPTAAKSVFGYSRNYASLEQIQGTGTDPRSDLYSLAATLYHLMTGLPPADALTRAMSVLNGEKDPLVPAYKISAEIPFGVSEVLTRAMALNASHRPSSAAAMRELLREGVNITEVSDEYQTPEVSAQFSAGASLFTQNTAVMSDESKLNAAAGVQQTETEQETSVRTNAVGGARRNIQIPVAAVKSGTVLQPLAEVTESGEKRKSKFAVATVVLVGLFAVVGSAVAALYTYNSRFFDSDAPGATVDKKLNLTDETSKPEQASKPAATTAAAANENSLNPSLSVTPPTVTNALPPAAAAAETLAETVPSRKEAPPLKPEDRTTAAAAEVSSASAPKTPKEAKSKSPKSGQTFVYQYSPEGSDENVKYYEDRIETDEVVIDKKGQIYLKKPVIVPGATGSGSAVGKRPLLTQEQLDKMTPEQKEKIRRAFEMHKRMPRIKPMTPPNVPAPRPKPTTQN
jgi:predicted Ser/Thr protein kinase